MNNASQSWNGIVKKMNATRKLMNAAYNPVIEDFFKKQGEFHKLVSGQFGAIDRFDKQFKDVLRVNQVAMSRYSDIMNTIFNSQIEEMLRPAYQINDRLNEFSQMVSKSIMLLNAPLIALQVPVFEITERIGIERDVLIDYVEEISEDSTEMIETDQEGRKILSLNGIRLVWIQLVLPIIVGILTQLAINQMPDKSEEYMKEISENVAKLTMMSSEEIDKLLIKQELSEEKIKELEEDKEYLMDRVSELQRQIDEITGDENMEGSEEENGHD